MSQLQAAKDGEDPGGEGQATNQVNRSISHSLLHQIASPIGFGRASSPLLGNSFRARTRPGYLSHGPSLQSLVQSFINKVSRGTQTDCDDYFDQVSIASAATGFSTVANDLTKNRIKMFLNDKATIENDNEFADELHKLRYEINDQFGANDDLDSVNFDKHSVSDQFETELSFKSKLDKVDKAVQTIRSESRDFHTQTEKEEEAKIVTIDSETQVEKDDRPEQSGILESLKTELINQYCKITCDSETQTDTSTCSQCQCQSSQVSASTKLPGEHTLAPTMKYEFFISNANIICNEENLLARLESETSNLSSVSSLEHLKEMTNRMKTSTENILNNKSIDLQMIDKPIEQDSPKAKGKLEPKAPATKVEPLASPTKSTAPPATPEKKKRTPKKKKLIAGANDDEPQMKSLVKDDKVNPKCCMVM